MVDLSSRDSELSLLHRISAIGTRERSLEHVVREVLRVTPDVVPSERAILFLYDEEKDRLRSFARDGQEEEALSLGEPGIVRRVFASGRAEIVNEVGTDPDASPLLQETYRTRQIALAPLVAGDERLGVVAAINSQHGAFTDRDLEILSAVADRAAIAARHVRLSAILQRQSRELEGLHRLARLLLSQESLENVIAESVRIVNDLIRCEKMVLLLYDPANNSLRLEQPALGIDGLDDLEISLAEPSLASSVFRTATPLLSNDAANDAWVGPRLRELLGIKNVLVVPLSTDREAIGVLEAINSKKGYFDEDDLRFATLLGSRVGGIIELSRARFRERALMQRLREADRVKSDFVSILAHELKGPMTTIMGFGQTLEQHWDTIDDARRSQFVSIVRRETERLAQMVSDLLDMSRMEAGTLRYEVAPMSIGEVVDSIVSIHGSLFADHHVKSEIPDDLPLVMGDKERIRQVLMNLISNAARYSPDGTTITISADVIDGDSTPEAKISVTDEGIGIAPEDTDRIFAKFAMLPKPAWTKKGTGLGLFITKGIVEAHGGRLWVESKVGEGSTFNFTLEVASGDSGE